MMTCPDCGANLDGVPVGQPCPNCGGLRRDAIVTAGTAIAIAQLFEHDSAQAIDAVKSLQKDEANVFVVRLEPPTVESGFWFTELMTPGGRLLGGCPSNDRTDAVLDAAMQMDQELGGDEGPKEPYRDDLPNLEP